MTTFTFTRQFHGFGSPKTTVEFEADQLEDVLEEFTHFLRGCGYHIDGHLEVAETYPPQSVPKSFFDSDRYDESDQKENLDIYTEKLFAKK